jgi:hypothetical protein
MAQFARTTGGMNAALRQNQDVIVNQAGRALGLGDNAAARLGGDVGEDFLAAGRTAVNDTYLDAAPIREVDLTAAKEALEKVGEGVHPDIDRLAAAWADETVLEPSFWQRQQRLLREAAGEVRPNATVGHKARYIDEVIDALDMAAEQAGGSKQLLGQANQRYKLLATLEEINAVVEEGRLPAGELVRKLGREGFRGFGRRAVAEQAGRARLDPEIRQLIDYAKEIAKFDRVTAAGSQTSGREAVRSSLQDLFGGVLSADPRRALEGGAGLVGARLAGPASMVAPEAAGAGAGLSRVRLPAEEEAEK